MTNLDVTRCPHEALLRATNEFPTPFFLYEEDRIRDHCRQIKSIFEPLFPGFSPLFAMKATPNTHILKMTQEEGFGFDCSSQAEAWMTGKLDNWGMHTSNYTTDEELQVVLANDKVFLNLDDISLLDRLEDLGVPDFLSFRINPGITKGGMKSLLFGGDDAKYGVPHEQAVEAYKKAQALGVKRFGIHTMTGSNVLDETYFAEVSERLWEIYALLNKELGIELEYMNIGGGFGVAYKPDEPSLDLTKVAQAIRKTFDTQIQKTGLTEPKLMIEPGRWVTCDSGFLVGRVNVIKDGYKKFIGLDANCNHMPRPSIYGAYHHASVLGKDAAKETLEKVNVVGRICENNDQFAQDRELPTIEVGDFVAIHNCGAHAFAMGHNYNGQPRSAEYLLQPDGTIKKIRHAETIEDMFRTVV